MTACDPTDPNAPQYPSRSNAEVEASLDGTVDKILEYLATVDPKATSHKERPSGGSWCDGQNNAIKHQSAMFHVDTEIPANNLDTTEDDVRRITSDAGFTDQIVVATGEHTGFWEFYNEFGDAIWVYVHPNRVSITSNGACFASTDYTPTIPTGEDFQRPTSPLLTPSQETPPTS